MKQIICEVTEYLVNITRSLFTPTSVFTMENEEMFRKYVDQNKRKDGTKDPAIENNAEACWRWLTSTEALGKADRPESLIEMMTRDIAEGLDRALTESIGDQAKHMMVPRSKTWDKAYADYLKKLKTFIDKKYTMELCENEKKVRVNQTIWRKIEWVTMKHRGRQERPYPLLTKSLLPLLSDVLSRVPNAITEVSATLTYHC